MTDLEPTIGIETHAQLLTASKMFCSCAAPPPLSGDHPDAGVPAPNSLVCPVCLGMPGSLPVINQLAVEYVIMAGLALNCQILETSRFERKNYNYPDLVKGYQISQHDLPLCRDGWIEIEVDGQARKIGIHDVHLEEDTGKLMHAEGHSLIDFNRSGIPLMEVVTEPDFVSVDEVQQYALTLRRILRYLGISSGNMEEGAMRFEANVSMHPAGTTEKGNRIEIKNLNSLRALLRSVEYEIDRQQEVLRKGGAVQRETRGWDEAKGITFVQRGKESAEDYRYFPEPDLPSLQVSRAWVEQIRSRMPELPDARSRRFMAQYELSQYDAGLLTEERAVANYFEQAVAAARPRGVKPKVVANWITGDLFRVLHARSVDITSLPVPPEALSELVALVSDNVITMTTGKHVLEVMFDTGKAAKDIVRQEGLAQVANEDVLGPIVDQIITDQAEAVAQYRAGKETTLRFLVGQVMKATGGKADAKLAAELLKRRLTSR